MDFGLQGFGFWGFKGFVFRVHGVGLGGFRD